VTGSAALHVEESGPASGRIVVLVHGTMDRCSGMRRTARRLAERHRVVLYDRRGYGRSRDVGGPYGVAAQVDDLVRVLDGRRATVVGHSFGGLVALAAAIRDPAFVCAVGAYEVPQPWQPWWPEGSAGGAAIALASTDGTEVAAERFLMRMLGEERWSSLPEAARQARRAEGAALVGELGDIRAARPFVPEDITVPVVLGCGEKGAAHHQEGMRHLAAAVPGAELVVLPGVGHGVHLSAPDTYAVFCARAIGRAPA
jgi:pimeloyl-ACP methyl ester carboxylesterase